MKTIPAEQALEEAERLLKMDDEPGEVEITRRVHAFRTGEVSTRPVEQMMEEMEQLLEIGDETSDR